MGYTLEQHFSEQIYTEVLENGLKVVLIPKPGFQKTYIEYGVHFGSIHQGLDSRELPIGVHHFLEHKMFEKKDGSDYSDDLAMLGGNANAYTTFDKTVYYVSGSSNIEEMTKILIEMCQTLHINEESVKKESSIISEEIKMYEDMPDAASFYRLLHNAFISHPLKDDIAGTVEAVTNTTVEDLKAAFETGYHPSNAILVLSGAFDVDSIMNTIKSSQIILKKSPSKVKDVHYERGIRLKEETMTFPDTFPKGYVLYKESPEVYQGEYERFRLSMLIYLDAVFGSSSEHYETLLKKELINDSFGHMAYIEPDYVVVILGSDTNQPEELITFLKEYVDTVVSEEEFIHAKRNMYGSFVRMLNSPEATASEYAAFLMVGTNLFNVLEVLDAITYEEVKEMRHFFDKAESTSLYVKSKQ